MVWLIGGALLSLDEDDALRDAPTARMVWLIGGALLSLDEDDAQRNAPPINQTIQRSGASLRPGEERGIQDSHQSTQIAH